MLSDDSNETTEHYTGMFPAQFMKLTQDPDIEIIEYSDRVEKSQRTVIDVKIKRTTHTQTKESPNAVR